MTEGGSVAENDGNGEGQGKRVSWAELFFDLIFMFAVGQSVHVIVVEPDWRGLGVALGGRCCSGAAGAAIVWPGC